MDEALDARLWMATLHLAGTKHATVTISRVCGDRVPGGFAPAGYGRFGLSIRPDAPASIGAERRAKKEKPARSGPDSRPLPHSGREISDTRPWKKNFLINIISPPDGRDIMLTSDRHHPFHPLLYSRIAMCQEAPLRTPCRFLPQLLSCPSPPQVSARCVKTSAADPAISTAAGEPGCYQTVACFRLPSCA